MEFNVLRDYLKRIKSEISQEEYPETWEVVTFDDIEDLDELFCDPVEFADDFTRCDEAKPMPPTVADFVKEVYEEEIVNGSAEAPNTLGALYYSGRIGVQDFNMAVQLYTMASERGNRMATENLGYCYYYGRNVPVDYEKAFHYFAQGAFDGHLVSLYKIGDMYRNGYYVDKNEKEAFAIYSRCCDTMTEKAEGYYGADIYMRMGDCYFEGIGTKPDYMKALRFYQNAVALFIDNLMNGDFYLKGNYEHSVEREAEARKKLEENLPKWKGF